MEKLPVMFQLKEWPKPKPPNPLEVVSQCKLPDRYTEEARERELEGKRKGGRARHGIQQEVSATRELKGKAEDLAAKDFGTKMRPGSG